MTRRLCMLVHGPYPVGEPRVAREAAAARAAGWDVDVMATRREGEPAFERVDGVAVYRLPIAHRRGLSLLGLIREYVGFTLLATWRLAGAHLRHGYDVVHVHNPPDFLVAAALIPRLAGAKVVFDVHDLSSDMFEMRRGDGKPMPVASALLKAFERSAARAANVVVTVHEPYRRELIKRGVAAKKLLVVMNTVDERLLPRRVEQSEDPFRIVYHGSITPPYGVEVLLDAFVRVRELVPRAQLEVYGEGDLVRRLRSRVAAAGLANAVVLPGEYLPHRETLAKVNGASVGVVPNLPTRLNRFALSSKLFEYVALGIPVACSRLPTLATYFSDEDVRFFEPGDPESLAAAIVEIAGAPQEATRRAQNASARYEQYRWSVNADRYVRALADL